MLQLKILSDGFLKLQPIDSKALPGDQKQFVKAGSLYEVSSFNLDRGHIKAALATQSFQGKNTWYVWEQMGYIVSGNQFVCPLSERLTVPYYDQLENDLYPFGSCNVTSTAMSLAYLGAQQKTKQRFPDELDQRCEDSGWDRHDPNVLTQLVQLYGRKDNFTTTATIQQVKEWLLRGNPVVVHGYFTSSGHVVCIIGFDANGFFVHDPYGEWNADGYDRNDDSNDQKGKAVHYSYDMIEQTCMTDGQFWVHFISH